MTPVAVQIPRHTRRIAWGRLLAIAATAGLWAVIIFAARSLT